MARSLYEIVGVPRQAPRDMIGAACKRRIAKLEREGSEDGRIEIQAVRDAWSILGDDKLRAGYDASLAVQAGGGEGPGKAKGLVAEIAPVDLASELTRPRHLWAENWERYRKLVYAILIVGFFALSIVYNSSRQAAIQKRIEAANYEAEHGEPPPGKVQPAAPARPEEPFSAEKFENELKAREAEIREQVARDQEAQEKAFREKNERDNGGHPPRRSRYR